MESAHGHPPRASRRPWPGLALAGALLLAASLLTVHAAGVRTPARTAAPAPLLPAVDYGGDFYFPIVEPTSLDPAAVSWYDTQGPIVGQVFEGLTQLDDELEASPAIAQSWESSDAQTWTFHLRAGVRFHNGRALTPADVAYSFARVAADGNMWYGATVGPLIDTVTVISTDTLQITLHEPFAPFPSLLALPFMSVVPSETVGTIHSDPVGSGPFQFQSWTAGDSIALTAYEDYHGGRPYLDGLTFAFYDTEDEMYEGFSQGALDLSPVPSDRITEVVRSKAIRSPEQELSGVWITEIKLYLYGMKVDQLPFEDVRVRRALNYAVDRQLIAEDVAAGYNVLAEGPLPPGMQGYDPPVPFYGYDPAQALALLAQAGWTDTNLDGVLDDGAGTDLTVELWHDTHPNHQAIAEALADDLRDIGGTGLGATVTVSDTEASTYYDHLDQYPFFRLGWAPDYADPDNFVFPLFHSAGEQNHFHYSNPQVDGLVEQARGTLDEWTTRRLLYEQIETQVQGDAPILSLFYPGKVYVQSEDVLGLVIPPWRLDVIQMEKVWLFRHDHDVMVQAILRPKETVLADEPMVPVVKVRNAGRNDEFDVQVQCRILQDSTEVSSQTATVGWLGWGPDYVDTHSWLWERLAAGDYTIECTTLLPGDEDTGNDQKRRDFTVTEDAHYDAYVRDNAYDDGSVCTYLFWQSPDIWVRHRPDGIPRHENPILGQTNYVYVRVRNLGSTPIPSGTLEVYYHDPSAGIRCGDWRPVAHKESSLDPYVEVTYVKVAWVPPASGHTCLFARFSSPDDPVSAECDVACDNNIAQRNVEVVALEEAARVKHLQAGTGQASVAFEVNNIHDLPAPVDLVVVRGTYPSTGSLELEFGRDLFQRWQDAGGGVEGGLVVPDTSRISVTHPISTTVFSLPLGVRESQLAWLVLEGPVGAEFALHVSERIHGQVVGGMTYHTPLPWMVYLPLVLKDPAP